MNDLISKKVFIYLLSISSIVFAGSFKNYQDHAKKLENFETEEKEVTSLERSVASKAGVIATQMYLPLNLENSLKINTNWEITRIVGSDDLVAYDKLSNPDDAKKFIQIKMELVGNGVVRINKDNDQIYKISLLSDFGTIAIYKKIGSGYEILEAKKIVKIKNKSSLSVSQDVELVLERALNQSVSDKVLEGDSVSGQVTLNSKEINGLSVELKNPHGDPQVLTIDNAELMDGGAFKTEVNGEEISGVVFNNGINGFRISFVTGPMAGAMLNFVTKEEMVKINAAKGDVQSVTEDAIEERKKVSNDIVNNEEVRILSANEIKETAEEKGFSF